MMDRRFNQIRFERWLENNQTSFIIFGVLLLVLGLILLALKRANIFRSLDSKQEKNVRLDGISVERGGMSMQPGLREDRKISEYERKKRTANLVFSAFRIITICFVFLFIISLQLTTRVGWNLALLMAFLYPVTIGIGVLIVLYLANAMICAAFDHVIEMCYANQYRIVRDYSCGATTPAPKAVEKPFAETMEKSVQ